MIKLINKYLVIFSVGVSTLVFNGCGAATGPVIDTLLATLNTTTQGAGPTFAESGLSNDQINAYALQVLEDAYEIDSELRSSIISLSGISVTTGPIDVTIPDQNTSSDGGTATFSGSVKGANNPPDLIDVIISTIATLTDIPINPAGIRYTGSSTSTFDMSVVSGVVAIGLSTEQVYSLTNPYGAKATVELTITITRADAVAPAVTLSEGRVLLGSGSDIYSCPFSYTDITDPSFVLICNLI